MEIVTDIDPVVLVMKSDVKCLHIYTHRYIHIHVHNCKVICWSDKLNWTLMAVERSITEQSISYIQISRNNIDNVIFGFIYYSSILKHYLKLGWSTTGKNGL